MLDDRQLPALPYRRRLQPAWLLGARDFSWRWRRYLIASLACGLVLGLALLLSGIKAGFDNEIHRTLRAFGASAWLVSTGSSGPFTAPAVFSSARVTQVSSLAGVRSASPVALIAATAATPGLREINLIGVVPGGVGSPGGRAAALLASGQAIVDASLGVGAGQRVTINGEQFRVGALTHGLTYFAGTPSVRLSLAQVQRLGFNGQALASAIITKGVPRQAPSGLTVMRNAQVANDLARPVAQAKSTITLIRSLLWVIAAGIIGAILYLTTLDRLADFAVLKAIGVATRSLFAALAVQAVALSLVSALVGAGFCLAIAPAAGIPVEVPASSYITLALVSAAVASIASVLAVRRAVAVDPAAAFGG